MTIHIPEPAKVIASTLIAKFFVQEFFERGLAAARVNDGGSALVDGLICALAVVLTYLVWTR